jgi:hypothetical protein
VRNTSGLGKPEYQGENADVARASVCCTDTECGFEARGRFALIDLLCLKADVSDSFVLDGEIEPVEAQY